MPRTFARELRRILTEHGCNFVRKGKGDHEIWFSPFTKRNVVIDVGGDNKMTANATLKSADIGYRF